MVFVLKSDYINITKKDEINKLLKILDSDIDILTNEKQEKQDKAIATLKELGEVKILKRLGIE